MEARYLQRLMFAEACKEEITPGNLAVLARSWALLQDSIRVMRGIPSPGQLRPDLDPTQLLKAIKRSRTRRPIELQAAASAFAGPMEEEAIEVEPAKEAPSQGKPAQESQAKDPHPQ